ncbi:MAG: iron-sulfur cluster insertion protein ErpA [Alphaproteobacteria bacterium]|nr:iron-sulfur cluster insertion protein ErpA [Alphaproteobacteria bacterium]
MSDPFALATDEATRQLSLSDAAVARLNRLIELEGKPDLMLRVTVSGGGCSGYQYGFDFDTQSGSEDLVFERNGVRVVTDTVSMDLLAGSELDYVDDLVGAYFKVNNPNASSSCGCGTSFSV